MAAGTTYERVQPLNGGANGRVGTALSLEVSPGDKVKVEVYAKYRNISPTPNPNSFLVALASAFGVSSSSVGDELELYNELSSYAATVSGGDREDDDETSPKVFATILLFDRNYNLVDAGWDQISATANQGSS